MVVGIIAVLVSILVPALAHARRQSRRTVCSGNLHQIGAALLLYQSTFRQYPPQAMINVPRDPATRLPTGPGQGFGLWTVATHRTIARMLRTSFRGSTDANNNLLNRDEVRADAFFYCPEASTANNRTDTGGDRIDPNEDPYVMTSYFYAGGLHKTVNDPARPRAGETAATVPAIRKLYVKKEPDSRAALISDTVMYWGGAGRWRLNHRAYFGPVGGRIPFDGTNLGFGDGHVEWKSARRFAAQGAEALLKGGPSPDLERCATLVREMDLFWW